MEGLLSQHPSPHQFALPVDAHSYPSSRSSAHAYAQKLPYPSHSDPASLYDHPFLHQHHPSRFASAPQSLQVQTATPAPHEHEPEEQTAHPSRSSTYPSLPHDADQQSHDGPEFDPQEQQSIADALTDNPGPYGGLSRPLTLQERENLSHLDRLKFFLATAPSRWNADNGFAGPDPSTVPAGHPHSAHPALNRFLLPNSEYVSCVLWGGLYHITGTDIVRALVFRFEAFGRPVRNMKKFEEGVFSDLRNLKPGIDACLEEPKSPFLDLLFKYQCIRTQKKQKVFYWFSVPHDRLFLDALERDLKREKMGSEPTTVVTGEPALSFTYDPKRSLYEQFAKAQGHREGEGELEAAVRHADEAAAGEDSDRAPSGSEADHSASETDDATEDGPKKRKPTALNKHSPFFSMFSLFEGSPTYKQRRKKVPKQRKSPSAIDHSGLGLHEAAEFGLGGYGYQEPQLDRFGRETSRLSAEDMFHAQARGDFGGQSNPDIIATQKERQRRALEALAPPPGAPAQGKQHAYLTGLSGPGVAGVIANNGQGVLYNMPTQVPNALAYAAQQQYAQQMGGRPHLEQRHHTYPMLDYAQQQQHMPVRSDTDPYAAVAGWPAEGMLGAAPRSKAFVCPLFSCGRMFKRMEHLKRHLRTHTLERPFQCERCQKRFSRSDNLAQHVRTHERRAAAAAASGLAVPEGAEFEQLEGEGEEGEEEELELDELEIDGRLQYLPGVKGITSVQMCEVEVQGQVHEVQGDEEGLVTTTGAVAPAIAAPEAADQQQHQQQQQQQQQEMYYEPAPHYDPSGQVLRASPETSPYMHATTSNSPEAQWATVSGGGSQPHSQQPSPATSAASAFTAGSTQSQSSLAAQQQRLDASYHTHPSTMGGGGEYVTSISAPSHKLTFDHAALYPPELALSSHSGPIRRHRSATPSIARYGESIRRPYSAALSESGQVGAGGSGRAYHPYAVAAAGHHSAQSSPMAYTVPLGYDAGVGGSRPRHVRSSSGGSQLQEQMHQMLSLEHQQQQQPHPVHQQHQQVVATDADAMAYSSGMYRTDSPMQYGGAPAAETYEIEMAHHQHQHQHQQAAADVQGMAMYGMAAEAAQVQVQVQQYAQPLAAAAYYPHPTHPHHSL
ncbi:hypothetical protein C8Q76DRAFT_697727 [Earliella scabrosa]|nr:hypothetical protein C8Q76DRAFT_697727 [Earliella scabrosa]